MIRPTININGTSKDDLIDPRIKAMGLLRDAIEALKQVTPNGRDYPGDDAPYAADREEHYRRINAMNAIRDAIYEEAIRIKLGGDA